MSARHRRRLERESALKEEVEDESSPDDAPRPARAGVFLAFADSDSDDSYDGSHAAPQEAAAARDDKSDPTSQQFEQRNVGNINRPQPRRTKQSREPKIEDDDAILSAIATATPTEGPEARILREILVVSERNLNADGEVNRILGLFDRPPQQGPPQAMLGHPAGGGRRKARYTLVNPEPWWVAAPTKTAGGFSMVKLGPAQLDGTGSLFAFEPSSDFESVDEQYRAVVSSGDPGLIADLLRRVPYHLPGLMALSQYHRTLGQHEAAGVLLRQALFVMESAWHPSYRPWDAAAFPCQLQGRVDDEGSDGRDALQGRGDGSAGLNAAAMRLLWLQMMQAARAGAPRAAYELSKLLLQAGPVTGPGGDPSRALLCADYFALRCGQYEAVLQLTGGVEERDAALSRVRSPLARNAQAPINVPRAPLLTLRGTDVPVCMALPNLAYSRALSLFHLELAALRANKPECGPAPASASISAGRASNSDASAASFRFSTDTSYVGFRATRMLVRAMLAYPHAVLPLLTALGLTAKDTGYGAAAAAVAQVAAPGARSATSSATHPDVTLGSACKWASVFGSRLFGVPYTQYKRLKADGAFAAGDDDEDNEDDGASVTSAWSPALEKLIDVFIARHVGVWRSKEVIGWVFSAARLAIGAERAARTFEAGESDDKQPAPPQLSSDDLRVFGGHQIELAAAEANTAAAIRQEIHLEHRGAPGASLTAHGRALRDALRHYARAVASDFSDELTTIAADVLAGEDGRGQGGFQGAGGGDWRVIPPERRLRGIWLARPFAELDLSSSHPLWVLLASVLPWNLLPGVPPTQDAPLWGPALI